ncbi:MAG: hypothetical protein VKP70_00870 [Cyanobacteriota bacterium]|nr:hypothetical protein [Cyanobacteriota bacterium]
MAPKSTMHNVNICVDGHTLLPAHDKGDRGITPPGAVTDQVQNALNLFLTLKSPAQMPALLTILKEQNEAVRLALESLHYVHFARFLPSLDGSVLMVITEYDGDLNSYLMDFVAVLGPVFTAILDFVKDAPRLPVEAYPEDFLAFVRQHNMADVRAWSAYPLDTVIEVQGPRRTLPPPLPPTPMTPIDLADVQGNILRGCRVRWARHFALQVEQAAPACRFLAGLVSGDDDLSPQVSTAAPWQARPAYFLNIGFTHDGLGALGVAPETLQLFPEAFRQGPAPRAGSLGDTGASAPCHWTLGQPDTPVHILVSLYADGHQWAELERRTAQLRERFAHRGLKEVSCHEAEALPDGRYHFGYRDGIAQPRIAGVASDTGSDLQPESSAGEFLLGKGYINQYNGNFIGDLPSALCDNATYAAVRVMAQDVALFETFLERAAKEANMDKELIAAKLMGRWRDGTPLSLSPECPMAKLDDQTINRFDYAPTAEHPSFFDDSEGLRCPMGSHMRRLNPRGGLSAGQPHSRRIIRRGLPYGPPYGGDPSDQRERGLFGLFICGDLSMQFEFLLANWANLDIGAPGLRNTRDPIIGAQPEGGGTFVIRTADGRDPIEIHCLERFVNTRGSLYLLMPGLGGLRFLASL